MLALTMAVVCRLPNEILRLNQIASRDSWCLTQNIDPFSAPLSSILEFLLEQFNMGKQYRTNNTLRSAISMAHEIDGTLVGKHP